MSAAQYLVFFSGGIFLALLPLLAAAIQRLSIPRKYRTLLTETRALMSEERLDEYIGIYFRSKRIFVPAAVLSFLYAVCFLLGSPLFEQGLGVGKTEPGTLILVVTPVLYALAGAYVRTLLTILRRLTNSDLAESVFLGGIYRAVIASGVAFAISAFVRTAPGIIYYGLGLLIAEAWEIPYFLTRRVLALRGKKAERDLRLEMINGISFWTARRLADEGIENVQNLATADIEILVVRTPYSVRTLADWIDQAILLNRLTAEQVRSLVIYGVSGAIDFASVSPAATGNSEIAELFGAKLSVEPSIMSPLMDSLFEDDLVRQLWAVRAGQQYTTGVPPQAPDHVRAEEIAGALLFQFPDRKVIVPQNRDIYLADIAVTLERYSVYVKEQPRESLFDCLLDADGPVPLNLASLPHIMPRSDLTPSYLERQWNMQVIQVRFDELLNILQKRLTTFLSIRSIMRSAASKGIETYATAGPSAQSLGAARAGFTSLSGYLHVQARTDRSGVRIHYSPSYILDWDNVFGGPPSPVDGWLQPGRYKFGGLSSEGIFIIDKANFDIPPLSSIHLSF